jgi:HD-GYP domain-containing protein (c-di-GMP phosphodiesterase class II)
LALRHVKDSQHYLVQHLLGAAVLSIHFAYVIGLSSAYIKAIAVGGMLFDIGRFRLPEVLSAKTTKLTPVEFDLFRKHIDFSLHAIRQTEGLVKLIYQMVDDHHEKVDGSGYPKGKQDDEISVYGKMAAIIDAYDALTSEQQHKASMGPVKACQQLLREAGLAFDAKLVQAFVASMGSYPVGTCVALTNGRAGFVITLNKQNQPALVRQVFSLRQKNFIAATDISVDPNSFNAGDVEIDAEIDPQQYGIKFINHLI